MASGGVLTLIPPSDGEAEQLGTVVEALVREYIPNEVEDAAVGSAVEQHDECVVIRENGHVQALDTHEIIGRICHEHLGLLEGWGRVGGEDMDGTTNVTNIEVAGQGEIRTVDRRGIAERPTQCGEFWFKSTRLRKPQL